MQNLKDKMFNYEVTPPKQSWDIIAGTLNAEKTDTQFTGKKINKKLYYTLSAAAASVIIVFSLIVWIENSNKELNETAVVPSSNLNNDTNNHNEENLLYNDDKITVPKSNQENEILANNTTTSVKETNKLDDPELASNTKKYITITGPQGKPVKISSKAATLIVSSDDQNPPKPVWSAKVNKWKDIMKANTLAPTTANFLDIVGLTQALKGQDTP